MNPRFVRARSLALALAACLLLAPGIASANHPTAPAAQGLDGEIVVTNDRSQPIHVAIDGQPAGPVAPRGTRVLAGVPNGVRLLTVTSPGLPVVSESVKVPPRGRASLRVEPMTGLARIHNQSGVAMRVSLDGRELAVLRDGDRLETDELLVGAHTLVARPLHPRAEGAPPVRQDFHVRAGAAATVRLAPWLAEVLVTNPFPKRVTVFVDGVELGRVRSGDSLLLTQQVPGRHEVVLRAGKGHRAHVLAHDVIHVAPGTQARFAPAYHPTGDLRVSNHTGKPMTVELDGRALGFLRPGQTAIFRDLPAGDHVLTAEGRARHDLRVAVRVAPERVTDAVFEPPRPRPVPVVVAPVPHHDHDHGPKPGKGHGKGKGKGHGKGKGPMVVTAY